METTTIPTAKEDHVQILLEIGPAAKLLPSGLI
jgi:hypothetical protein